jgi:hypothetical protein
MHYQQLEHNVHAQKRCSPSLLVLCRLLEEVDERSTGPRRVGGRFNPWKFYKLRSKHPQGSSIRVLARHGQACLQTNIQRSTSWFPSRYRSVKWGRTCVCTCAGCLNVDAQSVSRATASDWTARLGRHAVPVMKCTHLFDGKPCMRRRQIDNQSKLQVQNASLEGAIPALPAQLGLQTVSRQGEQWLSRSATLQLLNLLHLSMRLAPWRSNDWDPVPCLWQVDI